VKLKKDNLKKNISNRERSNDSLNVIINDEDNIEISSSENFEEISNFLKFLSKKIPKQLLVDDRKEYSCFTEIGNVHDIIEYNVIKNVFDSIKDLKINSTKGKSYYIKYENVVDFSKKLHKFYNDKYSNDELRIFNFNYDEYSNGMYIIIKNKALINIKYCYNESDNNIDSDVQMYINDINELDYYQKEVEEFFVNFEKLDKAVFIKYYYISDNGEDTYTFKDLMKDEVYPEAYPFIANLDEYVEAYLKSNESVLFLYGSAGTGKSRLIRYIMKRIMLRNKDWSTEILYTSDQEVLQRTNIFIDYIHSNKTSLLVLEDMDNSFISRSKDNGNFIMNKFLSTSDGIIQTLPSKKMVFSSNIQNLSDIDEALIRQGRCFDVIEFRLLTYDESINLIKKLIPDISNNNIDKYFPKKDKYSLADVYQTYYRIIDPEIDVPKHRKLILNKVGF
jgi:hypothetical protein